VSSTLVPAEPPLRAFPYTTLFRSFINRFLGVAEGSRDLVEALDRVLEPGARVHLQNGDIVTPEVSTQHALSAGRVFPDLEVEFAEGLFPDDRMFARVRMTGTASGRSPFSSRGSSI